MIGNNLLPSDGGCLEQAPALCTPSRRGHRHLTNNSSVRGPVLLHVLTILLQTLLGTLAAKGKRQLL